MSTNSHFRKAAIVALAMATAACSTTGHPKKAKITDELGEGGNRQERTMSTDFFGRAGYHRDYAFSTNDPTKLAERERLDMPFSPDELENFTVNTAQTRPEKGEYAVLLQNSSGVKTSIILQAFPTKDGQMGYTVGMGEQIGKTVLVTKATAVGSSADDLNLIKNAEQQILGRGDSRHLEQTQAQANKNAMGAIRFMVANAKKIAMTAQHMLRNGTRTPVSETDRMPRRSTGLNGKQRKAAVHDKN